MLVEGNSSFRFLVCSARHGAMSGISSRSDISEKNRLERLVPSSKVIVPRAYSGLKEIATVRSCEPADILFPENSWRGHVRRVNGGSMTDRTSGR